MLAARLLITSGLAASLLTSPMPVCAANPVALIEGFLHASKAVGRANRVALLADQALALERAGQMQQAAARWRELAAARREEGTAEALRAASDIERTAQRLEFEVIQQRWTAMRKASLEESVAKSTESAQHLNPTRLRLVSAVAESYGDPVFAFASWEVKQFVSRFTRGAREPDRHLKRIQQSHAQLVNEWRAIPPERRVFLIGSGRDAGTIKELRQELRRQGFTAFFYDFCRDASGALCREEVVGAFFGTAGHAVLVDSTAASASRYVSLELIASKQILANGFVIVVISPSDVVRAFASGGKVSGVIAERDVARAAPNSAGKLGR